LINRASCIIIVTADANRNLYQAGFTKHVSMMCSMLRASGQKKSLLVVAVSSPYDFAMDKSIGTYICTFDFTETAMAALVRVLCGKFKPQGTLPGTLRKSRKVLKSRQHWLVEAYNRDRDARGLNDLLQTLARASAPAHQFLQTTSAHTFELCSPHIEEAHFVVRNSSTQALYGFCATYFAQDTGIIGALFVDPAKRNVSIGRSLQRRALRGLTQKPGLSKLQLGSAFPGVFLGIPAADDGAGLRQWFANGGWDLQFPRRLANLAIPSLAGWSAPEGLLLNIQRAGISFDLVHGAGDESVLAHVAAHASPEVLELYRFALQEAKTCGVVRAKGGAAEGVGLLGTVVVCSPGSLLAGFVPPLGGARGEMVGGIVAPVLGGSSTVQAGLVLQGLALMGLRQNKAHKALRSVLSWVQDEACEPLVAMGFEVVQVFEEFTNSPENVSRSFLF
jgi:beta-N-acetylhexosaminidase